MVIQPIRSMPHSAKCYMLRSCFPTGDLPAKSR